MNVAEDKSVGDFRPNDYKQLTSNDYRESSLKKSEGSKRRSITKTVVVVSNSSQRDHKRAQIFCRGAAKPLGLGKGRKGFEIPLQLHSQNSHAGEKKNKTKTGQLI